MTGLIALVGSGEFLPTMAAVDRHLMAAAARGRATVRVAIVPTAAAPEGPEVLGRWSALGVEHFRALGADPVAVPIRGREDAADQRHAAALAEADLIYFSGGDPAFLTATLAHTPALAAVREAHGRGAVLAGCSAGAMALGEHALDWRASREGAPRWLEGWQLAPRVGVLPHFDRSRRNRPEWAARVAAAIPADGIVVGIDEHTVLLMALDAHTVHGSGTITVFHASGPTLYEAGSTVPLRP